MKIIKKDSIPIVPATGTLFTGGKVTRQNIITGDMSQYLTASIVHFSRGSRNKWHTHTRDQFLFITAGKGIVADEKGENIVGPGDIVLFPAGEKHWHGATKDSDFSHLYVISAGSETKQLED
ncbi:MAG: cupin domain-containing protein [Chloroflexota bacterium]